MTGNASTGATSWKDKYDSAMASSCSANFYSANSVGESNLFNMKSLSSIKVSYILTLLLKSNIILVRDK